MGPLGHFVLGYKPRYPAKEKRESERDVMLWRKGVYAYPEFSKTCDAAGRHS